MKEKHSRGRKQAEGPEDTKRKAVLDERESLQQLFPARYAPDIGVFSDGKVEVMFKLTYSQAQTLAQLLKNHKL
jgi:hypothetical protein